MPRDDKDTTVPASRAGTATDRTRKAATMKLGKREIRTVIELIEGEEREAIANGFDLALSADETILHIECKQTGKAFVLPRLPAEEQTEARLQASAKLVSQQLRDHLAEVDKAKKAEAAKQPS